MAATSTFTVTILRWWFRDDDVWVAVSYCHEANVVRLLRCEARE